MDYTIHELAQISATQHPGVDEPSLREAELALGGTFPRQYHDLIKLVNAPEFFEWQFFSIKDPHHLTESLDDIVEHNKGKKRARFLSPEYIAFAESTGDFLCFKNVNGVMQDTIYLASPEVPTPEAVAPDLKAALLEMISYAEEDEDVELLDREDYEEDKA